LNPPVRSSPWRPVREWVNPRGTTNGFCGSLRNIKRGGGPVVGAATYQAHPNYKWDLDVNVVQIKIGDVNEIELQELDQITQPVTSVWPWYDSEQLSKIADYNGVFKADSVTPTPYNEVYPEIRSGLVIGRFFPPWMFPSTITRTTR